MEDPDTVYRVTNLTYVYATGLPYFQRELVCYQRNETNNACHCPAGYLGAFCEETEANKCYVQFTSPNLAEGCRDKHADSDYYVYSIPGFDPCNPYDFSKSHTLKYRLICKPVELTGGYVKDTPHAEGVGVGYEYANVVSTTAPEEPPNYVVRNTTTNLIALEGTELQFRMDFRDWKYMT